MEKIKVAILISGRGSNMKALVEAAKAEDYPAEIALVISNKKDAVGLEFAKNCGIKTAIVSHKDFTSREEFDRKVSQFIEENNCEVVCLAGFMRLVSGEFVQRWFDRLINIHPSLLPNFKGAHAVEDAIKAKARISGCTVHYVREEMDTGPIILQAKVEVKENDDKESLAARILEQEHIIYPKALALVCQKIHNLKN